MTFAVQGQLVPIEGGDNIPLIRPVLTVGRRDSCDICLPFPNISGRHCEFSLRGGIWYVRDLGSTNGTKVNGERIDEKALAPGEEIVIGKRKFAIQYELPDGVEIPSEESTIGRQSLMEKAGLEISRRPKPRQESASPSRQPPTEYDLEIEEEDD